MWIDLRELEKVHSQHGPLIELHDHHVDYPEPRDPSQNDLDYISLYPRAYAQLHSTSAPATPRNSPNHFLTPGPLSFSAFARVPTCLHWPVAMSVSGFRPPLPP